VPGPYPLPTLAATVTPAGITAPAYSDILASLQASFQAIYGSDAVIDPSSQDGQLLALIALAISDANDAAIACYSSYSPTTAQGVSLSSLVSINGITRQTPTNSTAVGNVVGVAGTVINGGVVSDSNGNLWNLPASVVIPTGGSIAVTVTAQQPGAISAPSGTINVIQTPTYGWQSFVSTVAATPGAPVETDAALRLRQQQSVSLPALTPLQSIAAAIAQIAGVSRSTVYENQGATTDANGVPSHSIAVVTQGGTASVIAQTIEATKAPGTGTYGTTSLTVLDPSGIPINIQWSPLISTTVYVVVTIKALPGYVATTGSAIQAALVAYINALAIGQKVPASWLEAAASLIGSTVQTTFEITSLTLGTAPAPGGTADIPIAFNAAAVATTSTISVVVT